MSGPFPLYEILKKEYEAFHDKSLPKEYIIWAFDKDHINYTDLPANEPNFALKINEERDGFLKELNARLASVSDALNSYCDQTRKDMAGGGKPQRPIESLRNAVVAGMNALLKGLVRQLEENGADALPNYFDRDRYLRAMGESKADSGIALRKLLEQMYPNDLRPVNETLSGIYSHIHKQHHAALCISGGGIRSATFGLGVIQGLARCGLLGKFHYISTVSGGGYIGSWLNSWIHRHPEGEEGVIEELSQPPNDKLDTEPGPLRHLREYSNYLSPKLGFLSADTWTLVAIYVRNLLLNWLVLVPLIAAVLIAPRLYMAIVQESGTAPRWDDHSYYVPWVIGVGTLLGVWAIAYIGFNRPSIIEREAEVKGVPVHSRGQVTYLIKCLLPFMASAILLTIFWAWYRNAYEVAHPGEYIRWYVFIIFGVLLNLGGFFTRLGFKPRAFKADNLKELFMVLVSGAFAGWLLWLIAYAEFFSFKNDWGVINYTIWAIPLLLVAFLVSAFLFNGLISFWTDDNDREWWSRSDAWILIAAVGWAAISALVVLGPYLLGVAVATIGGVAGLITLILGRSPSTPANDKGKESLNWAQALKDKALVIAAPVFSIFLLILIATATTFLLRWLGYSDFSNSVEALTRASFDLEGRARVFPDDYFGHFAMLHSVPILLTLFLFVVLLVVSFSTSFFVNVNRFSLHAMYRNRLIRGYIGASNLKRNPNKFTGFDPGDNIPMKDLWPQTETKKKRRRLFPVINMALNLAGGDQLAWQQRKAETFTATPFFSGTWSEGLGYRNTSEYGGKEGITLGTAVAISGAAASPNMGYHSSAFVTFILMLFNARLGWWLGNCGAHGEKTFKREGPRFSLKPMVAETLGMTNDKNRYVYLSDGGHFENLGLYEMVMRRCRFIVVSDGSEDQDMTFDSLGNAVRKIRIDLGIPIEFKEKMCIYPRRDKGAGGGDGKGADGKYCAVGLIRYSCVDGSLVGGQSPDGILIYIKPTFYGDEPRDIYEYAKANDKFPHESTADQFFTESQFESYRMLGSHIMELLCTGKATPDVIELLRSSVDYLYPSLPPAGDGLKRPEWLKRWLEPAN